MFEILKDWIESHSNHLVSTGQYINTFEHCKVEWDDEMQCAIVRGVIAPESSGQPVELMLLDGARRGWKVTGGMYRPGVDGFYFAPTHPGIAVYVPTDFSYH